MANCNFTIEFSDTPENIIQQAKAGITKAKGEFTGDTNSGSFNIPSPIGKIRGGYTIQNSAITLTIEDKPMFLSCKRIETELRQFLG